MRAMAQKLRFAQNGRGGRDRTELKEAGRERKAPGPLAFAEAENWNAV